jgi:hypothetical protein
MFLGIGPTSLSQPPCRATSHPVNGKGARGQSGIPTRRDTPRRCREWRGATRIPRGYGVRHSRAALLSRSADFQSAVSPTSLSARATPNPVPMHRDSAFTRAQIVTSRRSLQPPAANLWLALEAEEAHSGRGGHRHGARAADRVRRTTYGGPTGGGPERGT